MQFFQKCLSFKQQYENMCVYLRYFNVCYSRLHPRKMTKDDFAKKIPTESFYMVYLLKQSFYAAASTL